ncbi:hypothetical protein, partial [Yersinia frederiksenii]|uniref:hypothetical protein n=1 Tax=Yersinia frederiksenii TaxID=29484 RepID=UPI001C96D2C3
GEKVAHVTFRFDRLKINFNVINNKDDNYLYSIAILYAIHNYGRYSINTTNKNAHNIYTVSLFIVYLFNKITA